MKAAREQKGLSCRALAGKLHMAHSNLSDYENGRRLAPQHILEAYEAHLELDPGQLVELRQPAADEVYGKMRSRRRRGPGSSERVTDSAPRSWLRTPRSKVALGIVLALVALGSALVLAGALSGALAGLRQAGPLPATTTQSCEQLRQYRVVTGGNVMTSTGEIVAEVNPGDLFDARTTHGTPYYAHRYYGIDLRSGVWGYVDSKKLHYLKDTCFP